MTMLTARNGVRQLVNAIEEDSLSRFVESQRAAAAPVVSSNLCEALTRLHNDDVRNNIDMSFRWGTTVALPQDATAGENIRIRSDYFGRVDEVRQELRAVRVTATTYSSARSSI